ncbi:M20 family metallopeptidase [Actinoplanes sp. NPDC026670]|uniref:M20 family metallopeptidase n=1 Tax=Actinoplanes sp. NPDC026670 TaxID=3154700 RepID=UPI0033F8F7A1
MDDLLRLLPAYRPTMDRVSLAIHGRPEIRFEERHAVAELTRWLAGEGFAVGTPAGGLETAFVARHQGSRPGPTVAVLMEYDALPGLGHGCGHNLIAAGGALAAILAARADPDHPGTLLAVGTPAEEGGGGKIHLLEAGVFDGVDAALMFHPADRGLVARHALAAAHLGISFHGRAAHAAKNPEDGRSALAAVQLFFAAVDMMRQFVPATARLHGIVTNGGAAPNVVPALAEATFYVRDTTAGGVADLIARVTDAANGAALATGCKADIVETAPQYAGRVHNLTMAYRCAGYLRELGIDLEPPSPANPAGSSDVGNLSHTVPVIHPYLQIAERDTPGHSEPMRDAAAAPEAHDRTALMAVALAHTALDALSDPAFLSDVQAEFRSAREPADD